MASKEVLERIANGEDLSGKVFTPEKPYMLIRNSEGKMVTTFYVSESDFLYALEKAKKNNDEILNAAEVITFRKIEPYKSGFGRNKEIGFI